MERRFWSSPTWDMMVHGARDSHSQSLSYFETAGQSSSKTLQHASYYNTDSQALPEAFTTSLQSMREIPRGDEITPLEMLQCIPDWAPITAQQPKEILPGLIPFECSPIYHSHKQRTSHNTRASKEDDDMPKRRREQNRKAQRAFRKRKEEYTRNLNDQLSRLIKQHQTLLEADSRQADSVQNLKMQIATLDARLESLRRQLDTSSSSSPTSDILDRFLLQGGEYAGDGTSVYLGDFATNNRYDFAPQSFEYIS